MKVFVLAVFAAIVAVAFACGNHGTSQVSLPADLCPQHIGPPCPRYFNNSYQDYKQGDPVVITPAMRLSMQNLLGQYVQVVLKNMPPTYNDTADDGFSVYSGHAGRALLFLRLWRTTHSEADRQHYLQLAKSYLDAALTYLPAPAGQIGFSDSEDGARAIEAVMYDILGDRARSQAAIAKVIARFGDYSDAQGDTFLPGLTGLIFSGQFLNTYFAHEVVSESLMMPIAKKVIADGAKLGAGKSLVYTNAPWGDDITLGAGAGGAGVLRILQDLRGVMNDPASRTLVKNTLDAYVSEQYKSGNFPELHGPAGLPGDDDDWVLVQWCHGAPGMVLPLLQGFVNFKNQSYLAAAEKALDAIWLRGLLTKGMMLCHGVCGNAYSFLAHYRVTGSLKSLYRALKFAEFTLDPANVNRMRVPDQPYALYAGSYTGAISLYADLLAGPERAHMIAWDYEL